MSVPVRPGTIKTFLKERLENFRVGDATTQRMVDILTNMSERIADIAKEFALDEARNTLLVRDIQIGFEAFLRAEGPGLFSPDTIRDAIDGITNEKLTELINLLRSGLEGTP